MMMMMNRSQDPLVCVAQCAQISPSEPFPVLQELLMVTRLIFPTVMMKNPQLHPNLPRIVQMAPRIVKV
jgi:hypothetical protein